jgi:5-methylcytosine-specific restriction endonuclease McrBC GTP-binding regulatory subunit McrB
MEQKQVKIENGEYVCDTDVSVEEWRNILQDTTLFNDNYRKWLIRFYEEPDHKSTCKAIGEKYEVSPQSPNGSITNFAKAVQKKLNRFEIIGTDGQPSYWIIVMNGKTLPNGLFEWTLRPELVTAIKEMKEDNLWDDYSRFKKLLEYFVAHLSYCQIQKSNYIGYEQYIKPLEDNNQFFKTGLGYKNQRIQESIKQWENYSCGRVCLNIVPNYGNYMAKTCYLNWENTGLNIIADWKNDEINSLSLVSYKYWEKPPKWEYLYIKEKILDLELFNNSNEVNNKLKFFFNAFCKMINEWNTNIQIDYYKDLLITNHNIILTGAPGTGKTYLAKKIKEVMSYNTEIDLTLDGFIKYLETDGSLWKDDSTQDNSKTVKYYYNIAKRLISEYESLENIIQNADEIKELKQKEWEEKGSSGWGSNDKIVINHIVKFAESYKPIERGVETDFVQFHPSYDYTDFVEGLRPKQDINGSIGFERRDGVFKAFCKKALKNLMDSNKSKKEIQEEATFKSIYENLLNNIRIGEIKEIMQRTNIPIQVLEVTDNDNIVLQAKETISNTKYIVSFDRLEKLSKRFTNQNSLNQIKNIDKEIRSVIGGCNTSYYWAILNWIYSNTNKYKQTDIQTVSRKPFVFIIDEINRGEVSKIFGELFYSIDPDYRGRKGRVMTQYQNIVEDGDDFKDGFFVPENVYIIGTMNDIDRSVECMDFAMRRRFAFKEITAEESAENMNLPENAKAYMNRLNEAISNTEGLNSAYHVGASYFLNFTDFKELWDLKLECLLKEYLRGIDNDGEKLKKLKVVYFDGE